MSDRNNRHITWRMCFITETRYSYLNWDMFVCVKYERRPKKQLKIKSENPSYVTEMRRNIILCCVKRWKEGLKYLHFQCSSWNYLRIQTSRDNKRVYAPEVFSICLRHVIFLSTSNTLSLFRAAPLQRTTDFTTVTCVILPLSYASARDNLF